MVKGAVINSGLYPNFTGIYSLSQLLTIKKRAPGKPVEGAVAAILPRRPQPRAGGASMVSIVSIPIRTRSFTDAIARAYAGVAQIHFEGMQYRRDIGRHALRSLE